MNVWRTLLLAVILYFSAQDVSAQLSVCGTAPLNNRIVGGQNAPKGAWPWQASLHRGGTHFCGGSLINKDWVMSAAHCFQTNVTTGLVVYLGRQYQQRGNSNEISRAVTLIVKHPRYDEVTSDNDIALLRLTRSVTFTDYIRPVCLAAGDSDLVSNTKAWVTGWGTIRVGVPLPFPQPLQEVDVPLVGSSACRRAYSNIATITQNMLCAGLMGEGGKDSCQGDSGGPMVIKQDSVWVQAGIVSFGLGCADADFPGVYARVSEYQAWINSQIGTNRPGFIAVSSGSRIPGGVLSLLMALFTLSFSLLIST